MGRFVDNMKVSGEAGSVEENLRQSAEVFGQSERVGKKKRN